MERPFPIIDGDGHVTETEEQVRRYMPEPFRSTRAHLRAGHNYWDISLGGTIGGTASDAGTWLKAMDEGGMETAVLFPTSIGLTASLIWEPEVAIEVARAYNQFMYEEFTSKSDRLKAVALLPMQDIGVAVEELQPAVGEYGMVGAMLPALGKHPPFGQKDYFPLYAEAQR